MRTNHPQRRRRSRFSLLAMTVVSLLFVGVGLIFTLWAIGVPIGFQGRKQAANPYLIRIPVNTRPIAAFKKVDRSDLLDPNTGWLKFQELPPQTAVGRAISGVNSRGATVSGKVVEVTRQDRQLVFVLDSGEQVTHSKIHELGGALINVSRIIGRVLKKDKKPGLGFREGNFFPQGTPEGIAGATPHGMKAIIVDANNLSGVHTLPAGAHIDLIANVPLADLGSFERGHNSRLPGAALALSSRNEGKQAERTEPVMLAQKALVLKPVYRRSRSLSGSSRQRASAVYEVALAVQPTDVIPLQSALSKKLAIVCVAYSMQPSSDPGATAVNKSAGPVAPVTTRAIFAYDILTYGHFENVATRRIRHAPVTTDEVKRLGVITSVQQLVGAVVRHDIPEGSFITEADLLKAPQHETPAAPGSSTADRGRSKRELFVKHSASRLTSKRTGTLQREARPNIVGSVPSISRFVPPGHKAVAIPWNRLYGAEHLKLGDKVDLSVTFSLEWKATGKEQERQPDGTVIERTIQRRAHEPSERTYDETLGFRGESWFVALNAKVIGPVGFPPPAAAARFLGDSLFKRSGAQKTESRAGPPVLFAIEERDIDTISAAMAAKDATFSITIHPHGKRETLGWKRIILAPQGIAAFKRLTPADLTQRHTRRLLTRLVRRNDPNFEDALTPEEIQPWLGRVLRSYKTRHASFAASDFFPADVKPGYAAAIAAGSTVYVADTQDIDGLQHFAANDHVAILFRGIQQAPAGVIAHGFELNRAVASVVVPRARILRPAQEGKTVLEIPKADIARLQAALARAFAKAKQNKASTNKRLHLVAVSLPPRGAGTKTEKNNAKTDVTTSLPDFDPASQVRTLEVIVGRRHETHVFRTNKKP